MARRIEEGSIKGKDGQVVGNARLTVVEPEPEPWYQLAGWWEGLPDKDIEVRLQTIEEVGAWVVLPPNYIFGLQLYLRDYDQTYDLALDIYKELTRKNGYSPTHARQAWDGARAFKAKGETDV